MQTGRKQKRTMPLVLSQLWTLALGLFLLPLLLEAATLAVDDANPITRIDSSQWNSTSNASKLPLFLGWASPLTDPGCVGCGIEIFGREVLSVFRLAIDAVNKDPSLLPNYQIIPVMADSRNQEYFAARAAQKLCLECDRCFDVMKLAKNDIVSKSASQKVHAVVGDIASSLTQSEALVASLFNVPMIAWGATSVSLTSQDYPYFLRVVPPDDYQGQVIADLITKYLKFKSFALISTIDSYGMGINSVLEALGDYSNTFVGDTSNRISFRVDETDENTMRRTLEIIKSYKAFVVFAQNGPGVSLLYKTAESMGLMAHGFAWVMGDTASLLDLQANNYSAWKASLIATIPGFAMSDPVNPSWKTNVDSQWLSKTSPNLSLSSTYFRQGEVPPTYGPYVYDAVLAFAHGMQELVSRQSNYSDTFNGTLLLQSILRSPFAGMTGDVAFTDNSRSMESATYDIMNTRCGPANGDFRLHKIAQWKGGDLIFEPSVDTSKPFCFSGNSSFASASDPIRDNNRYKNIPYYLLGAAALSIIVLLLVYHCKTRRMKRRTGLLKAELEHERRSVPKSAIIKQSDLTIFLDKELGRGVSGTVYLGLLRGTQVAVKKLSGIEVTESEDALKVKVQEEARLMASLRHPNIVLFMGCCLEEGNLCIVSQYCAAGSLHDVLMNESIKLPMVLRLKLALDAARGLLYLHTWDPPLIHRDIKSLNILVDESWNAKLADFGTLRVAEAAGRATFNDQDEHHPSQDCTSWAAVPNTKDGFSTAFLLGEPASTNNGQQTTRGSFSNLPSARSFLSSTKSNSGQSGWSTQSGRQSGTLLNAKKGAAGNGNDNSSNNLFVPAPHSENHSSSTIMTNTHVGTVRWSPPEMLVEKVIKNTGYKAKKMEQVFTYSEAVDVYSFGLVLWEIVTRKIPFEDFKFLAEIEKAVISGIRPAIPDDCPEGLRALIEECWDNEDELRPKCHEVVERLQKLYDSEFARSGSTASIVAPIQWTSLVSSTSRDATRSGENSPTSSYVHLEEGNMPTVSDRQSVDSTSSDKFPGVARAS